MKNNDKVVEWFIDSIDEMLESDDYDFANDTLEGIRASVVKNQNVTEGQKNAIRNIRTSVKYQ
jgi:hypothetical protein